MKYLLDTCVVSELIRPAPLKALVDWINSQQEEHRVMSVLTLGEIRKGIDRLPEGWGLIAANADSSGTGLPVIDGLIAATALVHGMTVVTRNVADLRSTGVPTFNPWAIP